MKRAIYVAFLNLITLGHVNVIERTLGTFDEIVVGIGIDSKRDRIIVHSFPGLLVDFVLENDIRTIICSIRNSSDFDFEKLFNDINYSMFQGLKTILYITTPGMSFVSSSAVKELIRNQANDILDFISLTVKRVLERRISGQYLIGITGEIASGKSYVGRALFKIYDEAPVFSGVEN